MTSYEPEVLAIGDGFAMTICISAGGHYWVSGVASLTAANWDDAVTEARDKTRELIQALKGVL